MVPVWSSWHEPASPEPAGLRVPFGGASCSRQMLLVSSTESSVVLRAGGGAGAAAGGAAADSLYGMRVVVSCL